MTTPSDAPPPALGELARRAKCVQQALHDEIEYAAKSPDFASYEWTQLTQATASARAMLASMCTPTTILQLVALATGGATPEQQQEHSGKTGNGQLESRSTQDATVREAAWQMVRAAANVEREYPPYADDVAALRAALTPERPADAD